MSRRSVGVEGVEFVRTRYLWGYVQTRYSGFQIFVADLEKKLVLSRVKLHREALERSLKDVSMQWKAEFAPMLVHLPEFREVSIKLRKEQVR